MDKCKHVGRLRLAQDHSILNPQKWHCMDCNTTESVWACLSCSHVACGRYIEEHALKHFQESSHPVALEVNELYVFCYLCDDYVLNDNATGDLKLLRSTLSAIKSQNYECTTRSGRTLRSMATSDDSYLAHGGAQAMLRNEDRMFTALWHRRRAVLGKVFRSWLELTPTGKRILEEERHQEEAELKRDKARKRRQERKRELKAEMEKMPPRKSSRLQNQIRMSSKPEPRPQKTSQNMAFLAELKETYTSEELRLKKISDSPIKRRPTVTPGVTGLRNLGNTCYMNSVLQVMWSGKWALVSPFAMLHSVWRLIPAFRGYAQQDAQEFLCELLDKVQQELETTGTRYPALIPASQRKLIKQVLNVVNNIFHGQLLSQVTCLACDNKSNTIEPFWDLSLEFPERYHCNGKEISSQYPCLLTEMLAKFTETEALEGKIYACDQCNTKRRKFSSKPVILTEAQKQLMVCRLPQVLRLHLKRFRWSGRNHREKIGVHVSFDQMLNMEPYCCRESLKSLLPDCFIYDLSAVVMHHGKGFGSGHYTAYCYNSEGGFWVHCNDSKLNMCTMEEVCKAQAYILFYSQRLTQANGHGRVPCPSTAESQQHTELAGCSMDNSSS
ncbi:PREDICTED: ubiquitin carboxyl-terminal hydrolase 44 isoform X2 [Pseudopodoces humilis]|uniref:ubiquitin carboxyl-terminal hydrolase 44 isoform X2 n=1 Tax=Pseudopodoces humilis TaxID=181119 RepID=UPI0006B80025|nr:PREDICTED: ubiquitin carboxyl-terminal hydrolase 44 isoform X2 [Pseudopodoces humilis]